MQRTIAITLCGVGLLWAALLTPIASWVLSNDPYLVSCAIVGVAALASASAYRRGEVLRWVVGEGVCTMLGLLGTVLGFTTALEGVAQSVEALKLAGVAQALATTAVGLCCHLYLLVLLKLGARR